MRIGVPPGVGDVYWVLTKLQAFRRSRGAERVTLCVQKCDLTRAIAWQNMVDFVDACEEYPFRPDERALTVGYSDQVQLPRRRERVLGENLPPLDCVLWPNAVLDRGQHLSKWLPDLDLDLSFKVKTARGPADRVIVYASSTGVNNAWVPGLGPHYWATLVAELAQCTGRVPTLVGAPWDAEFRALIRGEVEDLLGKTTLPEIAGVIERGAVVVGVICGLTILANHFRTPTVALYPDKFHPAFPRAWVAPDAPYVPIAASQVPSPAALAAIAAGIARQGATA